MPRAPLGRPGAGLVLILGLVSLAGCVGPRTTAEAKDKWILEKLGITPPVEAWVAAKAGPLDPGVDFSGRWKCVRTTNSQKDKGGWCVTVAREGGSFFRIVDWEGWTADVSGMSGAAGGRDGRWAASGSVAHAAALADVIVYVNGEVTHSGSRMFTETTITLPSPDRMRWTLATRAWANDTKIFDGGGGGDYELERVPPPSPSDVAERRAAEARVQEQAQRPPAGAPAGTPSAPLPELPASWDDFYPKSDLFAATVDFNGGWVPSSKLVSKGTQPQDLSEWGAVLFDQKGEDLTATWIRYNHLVWKGKVRGRVFRGTAEPSNGPVAMVMAPDGQSARVALQNFAGLSVFVLSRPGRMVEEATKGDALPPGDARPPGAGPTGVGPTAPAAPGPTPAPAARAPAPAPPPQTGGTFVVVVGIDVYADAKIPALKYAEDDAREVHTFFATEDRSPTASDRTTLLTGKDATRLAILRAIREQLVAKARRPEDTAILYFAGHGFADAKETYLAGADAELAMLRETAIPAATLRDLWAEIPAGHKVLLVDACHSGGIDGVRGIGGVALAPAASPAPATTTGPTASAAPVSVTIAASGPNEFSVEDENLHHGVFTKALLNCLRGGGGASGPVSAEALGRYLVQRVPELAARANGKQTPVVEATPGSEALFLTR